MKHRWFGGMDWQALLARKMRPPIIPHTFNNTDTRNFRFKDEGEDNAPISDWNPEGFWVISERVHCFISLSILSQSPLMFISAKHTLRLNICSCRYGSPKTTYISVQYGARMWMISTGISCTLLISCTDTQTLLYSITYQYPSKEMKTYREVPHRRIFPPKPNIRYRITVKQLKRAKEDAHAKNRTHCCAETGSNQRWLKCYVRVCSWGLDLQYEYR